MSRGGAGGVGEASEPPHGAGDEARDEGSAAAAAGDGASAHDAAYTGPERRGPARRVAALDVLRAAAILLVLFRHEYLVAPLFRGGWVGVDLFFVLSGFLISGLLFAEVRKRGDIQVFRFLVRRGFKIYPSFYVFIAVSALFVEPGTRAVLSEALFVQNYPDLFGARIWYHTWSLAVEEHFYVVLPILLVALVRTVGLSRSTVQTVFLLVAATCLGLRAWNGVAHPEVDFRTHYEATHLRADGLFFGVLLGYLHMHHQAGLAALVRRGRRLLAGVALLLVTPPFLVPLETPWMSVIGVSGLYLGFGIVLTLMLYAWELPGWVEGSWAGRALLRVGRDSYNIYLWHVFVIEVLARHWRRYADAVPGLATEAGDFLVYFVASIVLGHLVTAVVERPFLRLREWVVPRRSALVTRTGR